MSISGVSGSPQLPTNNVTGEGPPNTMPPSQQQANVTEPAAPEAGANRAESEPGLSDAVIRSRFAQIAV